jgi:ABC-type transport system involved in multi-copper enzyme maturation permease subunit
LGKAIGAVIAFGTVLAAIGILCIAYFSIFASLRGESVNMPWVYFGVFLLIAGCAFDAFGFLISRGNS